MEHIRESLIRGIAQRESQRIFEETAYYPRPADLSESAGWVKRGDLFWALMGEEALLAQGLGYEWDEEAWRQAIEGQPFAEAFALYSQLVREEVRRMEGAAPAIYDGYED